MVTPSDYVDLHALLDSIQEFIVVKDGTGRWLFCNQTALLAYGLGGYDYIGMTDAELSHVRPEMADAFNYNIETDARAWGNGQPIAIEKSFIGSDGRINTWEVIKTPHFGEAGNRQRLVIVSRNITERKLAETALQASEERLKNIAYVDALTGIPNRRGVLDLISARLNTISMRTAIEGDSGLLYLDLDRFKHINDELGHEIGDELLKAFAGRTQRCLRDVDIFGRIGGDEFIVFLYNSGREGALSISRRLCDSLSRPWQLKGHSIYTSSSIGVAFYPDAGNDVHTLLRHADEALYRAKRAGRSQIMVYGA